jgi:hypothetical protein
MGSFVMCPAGALKDAAIFYLKISKQQQCFPPLLLHCLTLEMDKSQPLHCYFKQAAVHPPVFAPVCVLEEVSNPKKLTLGFKDQRLNHAHYHLCQGIPQG